MKFQESRLNPFGIVISEAFSEATEDVRIGYRGI